MRSSAFFLLVLCGCAAKHIVPPEAPLPSAQIAELSPLQISISSFSIRGGVERDTPHDRTVMRQRFVDFLTSRSVFSEVVDSEANYVKRGAAYASPVPLNLEVQMDLEHSSWRTYVLDLLFFYPMTGCWPLTPQWGTATVKVQANLREGTANAIWSSSVSGESTYSMIFYSWYRTEPIEIAYREATAQAFTALADDLAKHREQVLAAIADRPQRIVQATPVTPVTQVTPVETPRPKEPERQPEHAGWIVAVMELSDSNAGDEKKAVDPELIRNLSDQLRVFIAQHGVRVIDRGQQERAVREIVDEAKAASYKECFDASCQIPLGKALAASHLLRSEVTRFGKACVLNGEMIELKREVTIAAASVRADCSEEGFLNASENLTQALFAPKLTN